MNIDAERKDFEAWMTEVNGFTPSRRRDGRYSAADFERQWQTWLARAQAESGVSDSDVASMVEEVAKLLSNAPFPSARSYAKAREIVALITRPPKDDGE